MNLNHGKSFERCFLIFMHSESACFTEDTWSMRPDCVHVLTALGIPIPCQKPAFVCVVSVICLLVLKQMQLLAPMALQHAFKDSVFKSVPAL